jgi:tetratricopeptide (TPR) repeat protein
VTVADLHPEDLLDRAASGTLGEAERPILEAHLAQCSACRFELRARKDFAAELGPELPVHDGALLVTAALERAASHRPPAPAPAPEPIPSVLPARRRGARRLASAVLIAATFLLATASFAAVQSGAFTTILRAAGLAPSVMPQEGAPAEPSPGKRVAAPVAAPATAAPGDTPNEAIEAKSAPTANPEPVVPVTPSVPVRTAPQPAPVLASAASVAPAPPSAKVTPPPAPTAMALEASSLFSEAGAARGRGDHATASRLYRELLTTHASAPEAASARVAFARLLLDDGNPAAALPLFDQYIESDERVLREEALVGRARALNRLGRAPEERRAWSTLIENYPRSLHAERARARLAELGDH